MVDDSMQGAAVTAAEPTPASGDPAYLDRAYDQRQWAPNMAQVLQRYRDRSEDARAALGAPARLPYGPSDVEQLDFFDCGRRGASVLVFFHGGAWRSGKASDYAFLAGTWLRAGVHVVLPDFAWVQDCGGALRPVAEQARRCLSWLHGNAASLGADPTRLFLSGHSSGAHLAAVLGTTDWRARGLPQDLVQGALLCSGIYELEPVRRSSRNSYVSLDDESVRALSPIRHLALQRHPMVVAWGSLESPEFQRQGRDLVRLAQAQGLAVDPLVVQDSNHFEILETLADPDGLLARAAMKLVSS